MAFALGIFALLVPFAVRHFANRMLIAVRMAFAKLFAFALGFAFRMALAFVVAIAVIIIPIVAVTVVIVSAVAIAIVIIAAVAVTVVVVATAAAVVIVVSAVGIIIVIVAVGAIFVAFAFFSFANWMLIALRVARAGRAAFAPGFAFDVDFDMAPIASASVAYVAGNARAVSQSDLKGIAFGGLAAVAHDDIDSSFLVLPNQHIQVD